MNNIDLKDYEYGAVKRKKYTRRVKLKKESHSVIYNIFKKFRLKFLKAILENRKNDIVNMKFNESDFKEKVNGNKSKAEKSILQKSIVIARLEAKIDFLERGIVRPKSFIKRRAIKLKKKMYQNVIANTVTYYSFNIGKKDLFSIDDINKKEDTKKEINEETAKLQNHMSKVMENVGEEEVAQAIDNSLDSIKLDNKMDINNINSTEVQENVNLGFDEESKNITTEEVAQVISENIDNVKVSRNGSSAAKINKFVDGEYSFKGPELDDEMRFTTITPIEPLKIREFAKIDNVKLADVPLKGLNDDIFGNKTPKETIVSEPVASVDEEKKEIEIRDEETNSSLIEVKREVPLVVEERQDDSINNNIQKLNNLMKDLGNTEIDNIEKQQEIREEIKMVENEIEEEKTTINEEKADEPIEESKENITFDYSEATTKDLSEAIKGNVSIKDLQAIVDRARILQDEARRTQERKEKAEKEKAEKEKIYNDTYNNLVKFSNELEVKCNENVEEEKQILEEAKAWDNAISLMQEAMNIPEKEETKKK